MIELMINSERIPSSFVTVHPLLSSPSSLAENDVQSEALEEVEENHIKRVLEENDFNITISAKHLKIGRNTLYRKIRSYGIRCS
jgi:transcriptional regulator with PAS, ATPase and Fis domain